MSCSFICGLTIRILPAWSSVSCQVLDHSCFIIPLPYQYSTRHFSFHFRRANISIESILTILHRFSAALSVFFSLSVIFFQLRIVSRIVRWPISRGERFRICPLCPYLGYLRGYAIQHVIRQEPYAYASDYILGRIPAYHANSRSRRCAPGFIDRIFPDCACRLACQFRCSCAYRRRYASPLQTNCLSSSVILLARSAAVRRYPPPH